MSINNHIKVDKIINICSPGTINGSCFFFFLLLTNVSCFIFSIFVSLINILFLVEFHSILIHFIREENEKEFCSCRCSLERGTC